VVKYRTKKGRFLYISEMRDARCEMRDARCEMRDARKHMGILNLGKNLFIQAVSSPLIQLETDV